MDEIRVGWELHALNNMIRRYFDFATHKREIETVTGNNGWIIGYLSDNAGKDIYQKDLEEHFTVTRSTTSKVLRLMEQKGLIIRLSVAHDARLKKIVLTDKAEKLQKLMKKDVEKMEHTLTKGFTAEEIAVLNGYVQRLKANLSHIDPANTDAKHSSHK